MLGLFKAAGHLKITQMDEKFLQNQEMFLKYPWPRGFCDHWQHEDFSLLVPKPTDSYHSSTCLVLGVFLPPSSAISSLARVPFLNSRIQFGLWASLTVTNGRKEYTGFKGVQLLSNLWSTIRKGPESPLFQGSAGTPVWFWDQLAVVLPLELLNHL